MINLTNIKPLNNSNIEYFTLNKNTINFNQSLIKDICKLVLLNILSTKFSKLKMPKTNLYVLEVLEFITEIWRERLANTMWKI